MYRLGTNSYRGGLSGPYNAPLFLPLTAAPQFPASSFPRRLLAGCAILLAVVSPAAAKPISPYGLTNALRPVVPAAAQSADGEDDLPLGEPQYNSTFIPLPPNAASIGYHATATAEFGDLVRLSGAAHYIDCVLVTMTSWAIRSDYPGAAPFGFSHPVTLKIYAVDRSTGLPRPADVLATVTRTFLIPWRPEPDPASNSALRPWRASDGNFYTGLAFNATFDLGPLARSLPDEVIFGVSFNTQHHGPAPLGVPGPYNALHVALNTQPPAPGADVEPDAVFWHTGLASHYADGGVAGVNRFRRDTGWSSRKPAVRFVNSAFGSLLEASVLLSKLGSADARNEAAFADADAFVAQALLRDLWNGNNRLAASYGRFAFNLLAAAVDELGGVVASGDPLAEESRRVIDILLDVSEAVAEISLGDAIIGVGNARLISQAQGALEDAHTNEAHGHFADAIDDFGTAWREAQNALR